MHNPMHYQTRTRVCKYRINSEEVFSQAMNALDSELSDVTDATDMDSVNDHQNPGSNLHSIEKKRFVLNTKTFIQQLHRSMYKQ